jgi:hypothetical protein
LCISSLLLTPILADAASCEDITEQIKHDTSRYGDTITDQHLPWMCLTWLEQKMGAGVSKKNDDNQTSYTWQCHGGDDTKLTVLTDNHQQLIQVDGQYSSERGAGVFSAVVNTTCAAKTADTTQANPPKTIEAKSETTMDDTAANTTTACDSIAEQIYDIATMSADHSYTHDAYPWESKDWLEKNFGTPKTHVAAATTYYTWHCQNDEMTTVAYSEIQPGPQLQLATLCKGSNCYLATVSRNKNTLHGSLKIIAPKPT